MVSRLVVSEYTARFIWNIADLEQEAGRRGGYENEGILRRRTRVVKERRRASKARPGRRTGMLTGGRRAGGKYRQIYRGISRQMNRCIYRWVNKEHLRLDGPGEVDRQEGVDS
jgi:hypothetical protein